MPNVTNELLQQMVAGQAAGAQPSENHIGQVGGTTRVVTAAFVRPADTVAYAVGDLIGASTTAGASNILTFNAARILGGSGRIIRMRGFTDDPDCVATIRLHLMKTAVASTVGDNAPITKTVPNYALGYGYADITFSAGAVANNIFSNGAKGYMANVPAIAFDVEATTANIYALMEARTAFTPKSGQRIGVSLELDLD